MTLLYCNGSGGLVRLSGLPCWAALDDREETWAPSVRAGRSSLTARETGPECWPQREHPHEFLSPGL